MSIGPFKEGLYITTLYMNNNNFKIKENSLICCKSIRECRANLEPQAKRVLYISSCRMADLTIAILNQF